MTPDDCGAKKTSIHLTGAILIYEGEAATLHQIDYNNQTFSNPVILPGQPLMPEHIHEIMARLAESAAEMDTVSDPAVTVKDAKAKSLRAGILPPEALYFDVSKFIFWHKPCRREMFIAGKKGGYKVNHPGLIFVIKSGGVQVFAVKGKNRPTERTKLFQAPYFNVNNAGSICIGQSKFPKVPHPSSIPACIRSFFDTLFTHATALRKLTTFKKYEQYLKAVAKGDPCRYLVPTQITLADYIQGKDTAEDQNHNAQPLRPVGANVEEPEADDDED